MEYRKPNPNGVGECRQSIGICELEAAETLAGLVRTHSGDLGPLLFKRRRIAETVVTSQDQVFQTTSRPLTDCNRTANLETSNHTVGNAPIKFCFTNRQLNSRGKTGRKLTEAEQEERRMRRVLANRESARQTIIRRQAMFEDLTRRAAKLAEENGNLKKDQDLAMKKYNSLKDTNVYLKAKLAEIKKTDLGDKQEKSRGSTAVSSGLAPRTSTSSFSSGEPCLVPSYWPTMHPFRDVTQFQYEPRSHVNPFHVLVPPISIQQAREDTVRTGGLFFFPITCLLPFVAHRNAVHPQDALESSSTRPSNLIQSDEMR